jgi:hypothetical protein
MPGNFSFAGSKETVTKRKEPNTSHLAVALKVEIRLGTGDGHRLK